ncbi:hypothetical protein ANN_14053 [Periplaneta americana]|uniref:Uncharacterized protein n=1 Tax=Periplaneta americana TaxID=6978 RepID=A0ABQ8SV87_PERAM|nr:hypothetical protein ANN_14053 [Periplaneta americana]
MSKGSEIRRRVQGCPSSPILFNIYLNDLVKNCFQNMVGMIVGGRIIKCITFVDDMAFLAEETIPRDMLLELNDNCNEFQSLGRAIVKEDEYEEVRWDGIVSIVSWRERVFRLWWEESYKKKDQDGKITKDFNASVCKTEAVSFENSKNNKMTSYVLNVYLVIVTTDILCLCSKSNSVECSGTSVLQKKPDYKLSTPEMVIKYGYPAETHTVATEDGYILTIHRIPYSPNNTTRKHRPVVFLQHGLLCSSFDWIILGPGKALAYLLADEGYDVWIGNARGNVYSRKHKSFTLQQRQFWNFSWHEMGVYDLPAVIDFILARTDQQDLSYFGHSMGTTMFLVLMSMKPMYNSKIRLMVAFAPVAFMSHIRSQFTKIAIYSRTGEEADQLYNSDYFPPSKTWGEIVQVFCSNWAITQHLCSSLIFILGGFDPQQLDRVNGENIDFILLGSSTESYPAFARIGLRENPGKNLNQVTCPDQDSNPGHLVSRPDALTVTPQVWTENIDMTPIR